MTGADYRQPLCGSNAVVLVVDFPRNGDGWNGNSCDRSERPRLGTPREHRQDEHRRTALRETSGAQ